jgi:hypothetical protein
VKKLKMLWNSKGNTSQTVTKWKHGLARIKRTPWRQTRLEQRGALTGGSPKAELDSLSGLKGLSVYLAKTIGADAHSFEWVRRLIYIPVIAIDWLPRAAAIRVVVDYRHGLSVFIYSCRKTSPLRNPHIRKGRKGAAIWGHRYEAA